MLKNFENGIKISDICPDDEHCNVVRNVMCRRRKRNTAQNTKYPKTYQENEIIFIIEISARPWYRDKPILI